VMERLGLGPEAVARRNPRLVYARMTGWGQQGPLAQAAGHDINYISIAGALAAIGAPGGPPVVPLNLVGDYGGGSLYLVVGILAALLEARDSGRGQVVDAAICDGVVSLMSLFQSLALKGRLNEARGTNMLDGGAPYYGVYETADGGHISLGPIEPKFFALLAEKIDLPEHLRDAQHDRARWPELRARIAAAFATRTRDEWEAVFLGSDACVVPMLGLGEAPRHPYNASRDVFLERDGVPQPAPAPRFSRTVPEAGRAPGPVGADTEDVLAAWGLPATEIAELKAQGIVGKKP